MKNSRSKLDALNGKFSTISILPHPFQRSQLHTQQQYFQLSFSVATRTNHHAPPSHTINHYFRTIQGEGCSRRECSVGSRWNFKCKLISTQKTRKINKTNKQFDEEWKEIDIEFWGEDHESACSKPVYTATMIAPDWWTPRIYLAALAFGYLSSQESYIYENDYILWWHHTSRFQNSRMAMTLINNVHCLYWLIEHVLRMLLEARGFVYAVKFHFEMLSINVHGVVSNRY